MANYDSIHTGAQIDNAVAKVLAPDTTPEIGSGELITSGAVATGLAAKAPIASPALTGNPTAPTQATSNNSTRLATTAFVHGITDGKLLRGFQAFSLESGNVLTLGVPAAYRGLMLFFGASYYVFTIRTTSAGTTVTLTFIDNLETHTRVTTEDGRLIISNPSTSALYAYALQFSASDGLTEISREPIT